MKMHIDVFSWGNRGCITKNYEYLVEISKSDIRIDVLTEMVEYIKKLNSASICFTLLDDKSGDVLYDILLYLNGDETKNFAFITLDYMDMFALKAGEAKLARELINKYKERSLKNDN